MNIAIRIDNVLENVKISADIGDKIALRGENGSGKTTILKCLAGMCMAMVGEIKYDELTLFRYPLNFMTYIQWISYIKKNVFFVERSELFYKDMSIYNGLIN